MGTDIRPLRLAQLLALSELSSALLLPGAYMFPFTWGFRVDNWSEPALLLGNLLAISFVAIPAATLIGLLTGRISAFWGLYLSPIVSLLFGVSAVPFVAHAVPAGPARTVLLVVTNVAAILLAIWLRTRLKPRQRKARLAQSASEA